jgi:hypothetical protein
MQFIGRNHSRNLLGILYICEILVVPTIFNALFYSSLNALILEPTIDDDIKVGLSHCITLYFNGRVTEIKLSNVGGEIKIEKLEYDRITEGLCEPE